MTSAELLSLDERLCGMVDPSHISGDFWVAVVEHHEVKYRAAIHPTESLDACMRIYAELRKRGWVAVTQDCGLEHGWCVGLGRGAQYCSAEAETLPLAWALAMDEAWKREKVNG